MPHLCTQQSHTNTDTKQTNRGMPTVSVEKSEIAKCTMLLCLKSPPKPPFSIPCFNPLEGVHENK